MAAAEVLKLGDGLKDTEAQWVREGKGLCEGEGELDRVPVAHWEELEDAEAAAELETLGEGVRVPEEQ